MDSNGRSLISPRLVFGLVIMALGTLFLLDNLHIVAFERVSRWWPLAPIAIGLTLALQPTGRGSRGFGWFLVVAGGWALLNELAIVDLDFDDVFPLLLIVFGGWLVWRTLRDPGGSDRAPRAAARPQAGLGAYAPGQPQADLGARAPHAAPADEGVRVDDQPRPDAAVSGGDTLSAFAFAGHTQKASASRNFRGADLTAIIGGCTIDLRNADMGAEPAVIDAFTFWGGIEIIVPEDWVVINKVLPLLGGAEDATHPAPGASKELLVRGTAMMGGVKIANGSSD